ncbi:MAG: hypothetical protein N3F09_00330 [Bacteroidia bacterium]|nr:hypothetical protein [Bacteroidia bacterium]
MSVQKNSNTIILNYSDNGRKNSYNIPENTAFADGKTFGYYLIKALVDQLDGEITVSGENNKNIRVVFNE